MRERISSNPCSEQRQSPWEGFRSTDGQTKILHRHGHILTWKKWEHNDFTNFGELQRWLAPWGIKQIVPHTYWIVWGQRCLALLHRSWGLEGWNTKQHTKMSSVRLLSQSRLEHWGPRRSHYIIPVRLETAFSAKHPDANGQSSEESKKITQRNTIFRKLCINIEWLILGGVTVIASINQSIFWHI